jgi:DNA-binding response OmpR family regulator
MKKILVIDDDVDILEALQVMLEMDGYVVQASTKDDSLQKISEDALPDLILLDVLLSGKDGRTICKQLKSQKKTKDIPVILMSAHPNAKETSLEAGADYFVAKPFEMDELLESISNHISSHNYRTN